MIKPLLKLLTPAILLSPIPVFADYEEYYEGVKYLINTTTNEATAVGFDDTFWSYSTLYIADEVYNIPVTTVGAYAFYNDDNTELSNLNLILGKNIRTIEECAFASLHFSSELTLPESLTEIGAGAFGNCGFNGALTIPSKVVKIGKSAFAYCNFTGSLNLPNSIKEIGNNAFSNCGFNGTLSLPNSLTEIRAGAFSDCKFSGALILPENLSRIGEGAFCGCRFTGELVLPESLSEIGGMAFYNPWTSNNTYNCLFTSIKALSEVPPNCNTQNYNVFCDAVRQNSNLIVPPGSISVYQRAPEWENFNNISSTESAVTMDIGIIKYLIDIDTKEATVLGIADGNFPFTDLIIPDNISYKEEVVNVVSINPGAFTSLYFTGILSLGKNIRSIGSNAFKDCTQLTGLLVLPPSLSFIGDNAFNGCSNLKGELIFPSSITKIENRAFMGCSSLNGQLKLPSELTEIGDYAFYNCRSLSGTLMLPITLTDLGAFAFYNCEGLTGTLTLPSKLTELKDYVFNGCKGLSGTLIIPQSVTKIGYGSFKDCSGFTGSLNIPESVTTINISAFSGCRGLNGNLTLPSTLSSIQRSSFEACSNLTGTLELPESIKWIGMTAFYKCSRLESIVLPSSLDIYDDSIENTQDKSSIQERAFAGCSSLNKVICKKESAPTCNLEAFDSSTYSKATLLVPTNSLRNYQTTDPWRKFSAINSLEPLSAIEFLEANVVCPLGGTVRLFLKKSPAGATGDITFISGNTAVATVDANGVVTGVAKGSTAIVAMCGTLTASCVVTVEDPTIAATDLEFEGIIGNVGETVAIGAKVLPADATDPTISWQSSNPEIAAVDLDGTVWFNAAGNATVTAECQGHDFSVPFVVREVVARALNVFPVEAVGNVGHEFSLLALHEPENTTDKSVTWESSDPAVATVSKDGRVSLASLGTAQIIARSGEYTAVCAVTVDNNTVSLTEMAATGVVIDIVDGGIVVRNAPMGESIAVYTVDGKVANGAIVESDETKLNLAAGIYIVKVSPSTVAKVLVK